MTALVLDAGTTVPWRKVPTAYSGGVRYLSSYPQKNLSVAEAAEARAAGKPLALVYEDGALDFAGGANAGVAKAHVAAPLLRELSWPADRPVYAALDGNLSDVAYPMALEGVKAFAGALGRPEAVYGPRPFLAYCAARGVHFLWECASADFNTGPQPAGVSLQQLVAQANIDGVICDVDEVLADDWGQVPAPAPARAASSCLPVYVPGDTGPGVSSLQAALLAQGWGKDVAGFSVSGSYGAAMVEVVTRFCAGHHIENDPGTRWGPECWSALFI